MKALSMTQPWAALFATGQKRNETRSWKTKYRGEIAIHSASRFPPKCTGLFFLAPFNSALRLGGIREFADLKTGCIIGFCEITDCVPTREIRGDLPQLELTFGDYSDGRWAWICENHRLVAYPVYCRGALSLWQVPDNIVRLLRPREYVLEPA